MSESSEASVQSQPIDENPTRNLADQQNNEVKNESSVSIVQGTPSDESSQINILKDDSNDQQDSTIKMDYSDANNNESATSAESSSDTNQSLVRVRNEEELNSEDHNSPLLSHITPMPMDTSGSVPNINSSDKQIDNTMETSTVSNDDSISITSIDAQIDGQSVPTSTDVLSSSNVGTDANDNDHDKNNIEVDNNSDPTDLPHCDPSKSNSDKIFGGNEPTGVPIDKEGEEFINNIPVSPSGIADTCICGFIVNPSNENEQSIRKERWFDLQFYNDDKTKIKRPHELEEEMVDVNVHNDEILQRVQGSIIGMAMGDALGAHAEFRPRHYFIEKPVTDMESGGTWGLQKGQFTDDTSMALCLANSLIACHGFNPYDQLVRYKWWYHHGYMSSTGQCFDIGAATNQSLTEFEKRQNIFADENQIEQTNMDTFFPADSSAKFDVYCSEDGVAGNGALMRLAPVPLFFYQNPSEAVEYSGISGQITHGDVKAYDACRYYGALIVAALNKESKDSILDDDFYSKHSKWFGEKPLHSDIASIAKGSYKKQNGYDDGIRGKGYIVKSLEAALWAFWSDNDSFETGALAAVNLGDDTDTTAAIYGQLAGAYYGYSKLPEHWLKHVYAKKFMEILSRWIVSEGDAWSKSHHPANSESCKSQL